MMRGRGVSWGGGVVQVIIANHSAVACHILSAAVEFLLPEYNLFQWGVKQHRGFGVWFSPGQSLPMILLHHRGDLEIAAEN